MSERLLELKHVSAGYAGHIVLSDVNFSVDPGRWIAFVGPNASGKSTLLRTISGRHAPLLGSVQMNGKSLYPASGGSDPLPGYALPLEELPQFLTVRQCLDIYASAHGLVGVSPESSELWRLLDLGPHEGKLIANASVGTRQKLSIVLALMLNSSLLLLDEVFNSLDFSSAMKLRTYLRHKVNEDRLTILLATHSLDVVLRSCDEVVLFDSGSLARRWAVSDFAGDNGLYALECALAKED